MFEWFLFIILRTIYHSAFIFHMLIGLDGNMTPINIDLIRSKVKVKNHFCKKWFPFIILRTVYCRAFIFHMLIGLGEVKGQGQCHNGHFCKKMVSAHFLENYLSERFHM